MHFTVDREVIFKSLTHIQSVVEKRNTVPILSNVLISANDDKLSLLATDLDMWIIENLSCQSQISGSITVSAHLLCDIVRKLPEGSEIELKILDEEGSLVQVSSERTNFKLPSLPANDFPVLSEEDFKNQFIISSDNFIRLIDKTKFAISTEEARYYLNGIFLHEAESNNVPMLRAVATDGHRLAQVDFPLPEGAKDIAGIIIPNKTIREVRKLIDDYSGDLSISSSSSKIKFVIGEVTVYSKLIDGTFPDYTKVIPTEHTKLMKVEKKLFSSAVDRVSTISSHKSKSVKIKIDTNKLLISATSDEAGRGLEEIVANYESDVMEIGFNSKYLLDIASQVDGDVIYFKLSDAASPALIGDSGDESAIFVLMPMRV